MRSGSVSVYLNLYSPSTDIPAAEAEYHVYPVVGDGEHDDVWVVNCITGKPMTLSDEAGRAVLNRIENEQPEVWKEIRSQGRENSAEPS